MTDHPTERDHDSQQAIERICDLLAQLRRQGPLIHNITNHVVMNTTANALLALGGSPAMVHATDEVDEFTGLAGALVINIGTLSSPWVAAMKLAAERAQRDHIPWVLDPVGVGATSYRTRCAHDLIARNPVIVRANGSEVKVLAGETQAQSRGPDSIHGSDTALAAARTLAARNATVVGLTGASDFIVGSDRVAVSGNGHPLMARVTGLGCTVSALSAAFAAVAGDAFDAALAAIVIASIAGELAADEAAGPGSLQMHLLDWLYRIDTDTINQHANIRFEPT